MCARIQSAKVMSLNSRESLITPSGARLPIASLVSHFWLWSASIFRILSSWGICIASNLSPLKPILSCLSAISLGNKCLIADTSCVFLPELSAESVPAVQSATPATAGVRNGTRDSRDHVIEFRSACFNRAGKDVIHTSSASFLTNGEWESGSTSPIRNFLCERATYCSAALKVR